MEGSSSQLLYEQLERLRLQDHQFVEQLDREERAARESHLRGLEEAKSLHETVRQTAELEHKAFLQEFESQQRKALEEAQARILRQKEQEIEDERKRAELDAQLRKQEEEKRRLAEERQRRAQAEAEAEAAAKREAERKAQEEATRKAKEEADRKAKEEAERKAKEEAAKAEATRKSQQAAVSTPAAAPAPAPTASAVPPTAPSLPDKESLHKEYLALHQRLKAFRNEIKKLRLSDEQFKKDAFEGRTGITTRIGQIRGVKGGYKEPTVKVLEALKGALTNTRHTYDVRKLVIQSSPLSQQPQPIMVSLLFVYMLHILGKCIVSQFIKEGSTNSKIADNVGIGAITIFSDPALKCGNVALVDMLLAKIHRLCPVIFGIYGSERTAQGRARLGWREFDNQQTFNGIIAGISTGYGALFLRDLTKMKTPRDNPFPNSDFWLAISRIVNTPPAEVTETHLIALKALVSSHAEKFIRLYGYMGKVALRHALLVFPTSVEQKYPIAAGSLKVLQEYMKKDAHITL